MRPARLFQNLPRIPESTIVGETSGIWSKPQKHMRSSNAIPKYSVNSDEKKKN